MPELTPLDTIPVFDAPVRKKLSDYWITSAEEFVTVARAPNRKHGNGLRALAQEVLNMTPAQAETLLQAADLAVPPHFSFAAEDPLEVGTGAIFEGMDVVEPVSFNVPTERLPAEARLPAALPSPAQQGKRNTCVAFTLVAMYQHASGDPTDLSEQFIYWACKDKDGIPGDVGTRPDVAMRMLVERGVCLEPTWPYNDTPNPANAGQGPPPAPALAEARLRRISGFSVLPAKDVRAIQAALVNGQAVLFGLPINEHWTSTYQARTLGRVRRPLPGEASTGGHAMCAVGYRDDPNAPGGGYFIVRNSWGVDWGRENSDGPGYAHVPYRLVAESNLAAFVIDGVLKDAQAAPSAPGRSASPPSTGRAPTAGAEAPPDAPPAGAAPDVRALYAEARAIQQRLNALVEQLAALAQAAPPAAPPAPGQPPPVSSAEKAKGGTAFGGGAAGDVIDADVSASQVDLGANGIDGTTGVPLVQIDQAAALELAQTSPDPEHLRLLHEARLKAEEPVLALVRSDPNDLQELRWAVVVNRDDAAEVLQALTPLIRRRSEQQAITLPAMEFRPGETCGAWLARTAPDPEAPWQSRPPVLVYHPGETAAEWLARHDDILNQVTFVRGVPFYLLLAGRPGPIRADDTAFIPASFQYELDLFRGVGRLAFTTPDGRHDLAAYSAYAERVAAQGGAPPRQQAIFFAPRHEMDPVTMRSADEVIAPLAREIGDRTGYPQLALFGPTATRANLAAVLHNPDGPPALLVTATHNIGLPSADPRLADYQGALLCQDWSGFGAIRREHWFAAEDLIPEASVAGMALVCIGSYSVGCPQTDPFLPGADGQPLPIAPTALVARLPQRLLAQGALAVLGYNDRAWHYGGDGFGIPSQARILEKVITCILAGDCLGYATHTLAVAQSEVALRLSDELEMAAFGKHLNPHEISVLWAARNDARGYALFGDPAVRLQSAEVSS